MKNNDQKISISEIQIIPIRSSNGLVAFASCVVDNKWRFDNIGIVSRVDGSYRVTYPTKKLNNGESYTYYYPITKEVGNAISKAITTKYKELFNERVNDYGYKE